MLHLLRNMILIMHNIYDNLKKKIIPSFCNFIVKYLKIVWPKFRIKNFRNGNKMFERLDYLYTGRQDSHCTQTSRFQTYRPAQSYISVYIILSILLYLPQSTIYTYVLSCVFHYVYVTVHSFYIWGKTQTFRNYNNLTIVFVMKVL